MGGGKRAGCIGGELLSETWIIKDSAPAELYEFLTTVNIAFISNGESFTSFGYVDYGDTCELQYSGSTVAEIIPADPNSGPAFEWTNNAYKTVTFDTAPTGDLLAWLTKNADKQTTVDYLTTNTDLTKVADAIRTKGGTSDPLVYPDGFEAAILAIPSGTDTSDATGGAAQMLSGYTAYGADGKFTGSIQSLGAQTYQPSTSDQTIAAGKYLSGAQKIAKMVLQEKTVTLSAEQQVLTPPSGVNGFSKVTVPAAGDYFVDALPEGSFNVDASGKRVTLPLSHSPASLQDIIVLVETSSNTDGTIMSTILRYSSSIGSFGYKAAILYANGNVVAISMLPSVTGTISGNTLTLNIESGTVQGYSPVFGPYGRITVIYKS